MRVVLSYGCALESEPHRYHAPLAMIGRSGSRSASHILRVPVCHPLAASFPCIADPELAAQKPSLVRLQCLRLALYLQSS